MSSLNTLKVIVEMDADKQPTAADVINIRAMFSLLWRRRLLIVVCVLIGTAIFAVIAFTMTPVYRATCIMVPANLERSGVGAGLSSSLGSVGGLASLIGLTGGPDNTETQEALAVLRSREFTGRFISDRRVLRELYPKIWDPVSDGWKKGTRNAPSLGQAFDDFDSLRQVTEDKRTGLISLQIDWRDPELAAQWANELVDRLNTEMRERAIARADSAVEYLQKELNGTALVETRESISRLLAVQVNRRMLASVTQQYAFSIVDKATAPERSDPIRPRRGFLLATGITLGFVLSILGLLAFEAPVPKDKR